MIYSGCFTRQLQFGTVIACNNYGIQTPALDWQHLAVY